MNIKTFAKQMATNAQTIKQLVADVSDEQAKWKPDADTWSMLEVVNHLYDTERFDFRVRLDHILHHPGVKPPEFLPQALVIDNAYNEQDLAPSLQNFLTERQKSLEWLNTIESPQWENTYTASWGTIRAVDMFAAWIAHDVLHMRQLTELHYAWIVQQVAPYQVNYAGEW